MSDPFLQLAILQAIQVTVILGIATLFDPILRERLPRLRYAMWLAATLKCLVPPVIASPTGLFSWAQLSLGATKAAAATDPLGWATTSADGLAVFLAPLAWVLVLCWIGGATMLAVSWLRGWRRFRAASCDPSQGEAHERVAQELRGLAEQMGIPRPPALVLTKQDFGPAMLGFLRPTIVIPHRLAETLTSEQIRPLLAHELVHVKRGDSWVGSLQMIVAGIWWFHPLVWVAIRRTTAALEVQVDERTVEEMGIPRSSYASSLLTAVELLCRPTPIPGSMGLISCRMTSHRIRHMLKTPNARRRSSTLLMVAALSVLVLPGRGLSIPSKWLFEPVSCGQFSATFYSNPAEVPER